MGKEISQERLLRDVKRVLDNPVLIPGLSTDRTYQRLHDDHDGTGEGFLSVIILPNADMAIFTDRKKYEPLCFRNFFGGGRSLRVYNALKILAYAIELDNQEKPD